MILKIECTSHPEIFKKRHGQPLTKSIRFKVTLEVNVSRVKKAFEPKILKFCYMERTLQI